MSHKALHELLVAKLREAHRARQLMGDNQFQMHGHLGRWLIESRAATTGTQIKNLGHLTEAFLDATNEPWMSGVVEFMGWLVGAGLAWPLGALPNQTPITFQLTEAGQRFVATTDDDHPLLPNALQRVQGLCPGLPVDVVTLLEDALTAYEHLLLRPAIVLTGVAYEVAVEHVVNKLITVKNALTPDIADKPAAARIAAVKSVVPTLRPGASPAQKEARGAAEGAIDFADVLRRRRNEASHTRPQAGFRDRQEIEELLASAGRHLPALWGLGI
jgi:hypothetical protein